MSKTTKDQVCCECARSKLLLNTRGMEVRRNDRCASCNRFDFTVTVTNLPDKHRFVPAPPPPPPDPAQEACATWIGEQTSRALNYADESVTLRELPALIQRTMVRAFHAGWEAREKLAESEQEKLREQAERREG